MKILLGSGPSLDDEFGVVELGREAKINLRVKMKERVRRQPVN